jgi:phage gp46-like protein
MKSWDIDPVKRDYVMSGGKPVETDSLRVPAYIRLKAQRTKWLYAPTVSWGSDFWTIKKNRTNGDTSLLELVASRALQPLADDGRASSIDVTVTAVSRHGVALQMDVIDAQGEVEQIEFQGIG